MWTLSHERAVPPQIPLARGVQGLWWLPGAGEALVGAGAGRPGSGLGAAGVGGLDEGMLRLAAAARMNTDVRRACFCAIMGAEDAADAFERLLRLGLKASLDRRPTFPLPVPSPVCFHSYRRS